MTENEMEMIWNRLKTFRFLNCSLNQSIIENRLPFGMKRNLVPLNIPAPIPVPIPVPVPVPEPVLTKLKASDFNINFKDPNLFKRIEPRIETNRNLNFNFNLKFIPHKTELKTRQVSTQSSTCFDSSAILFFNAFGDVIKTNLTSNANGTVSNDKNNLAAILKQSIWHISFNDLIKTKMITLPQIQNNKLRSLKYAEYVAEEWKGIKGFGEEVEFISITKDSEGEEGYCVCEGDYQEGDRHYQDRDHHYNRYQHQPQRQQRHQVLKSKRNFKNLNLFVIGKNGNLKFSSLKEEENFILLSNSIFKATIQIEKSDTIFIFKGSVNSEILKMKFDLSEDFEGKILESIKRYEPCSFDSLIISRVKDDQEKEKDKDKDFDESCDNGSRRDDNICDDNLPDHSNHPCDLPNHPCPRGIVYVSHLDTKIGSIVNHPIPGSFGCTTRHSVIYRSGYFAALHHDASKINRFPDTINYIIRKMGNPSNLGKRMEQEGEESVLKRISDIQYFAYLLKKEKDHSYHLALAGGAKCVILSKDLKSITIHEIPILIQLKHLKPNDQIILLSPHFPPSILIKSLQAPTIQEWIKRLLQLSEVDHYNFKVSLGHFEIQ